MVHRPTRLEAASIGGRKESDDSGDNDDGDSEDGATHEAACVDWSIDEE